MAILLMLALILVALLVLHAAPTPTARVTPTGFKMPNGFKTLITFKSNPNIQLWEVTVKPSGIDGGDPIDTTTMHNINWRTRDHRALKTLTPASMNCAYDPDCYSTLVNLINHPDTITELMPSGDTICYYGYLQKAERNEHKEGEMPMLNCEIIPTNWDPVNGVEAAPVYTVAVGT